MTTNPSLFPKADTKALDLDLCYIRVARVIRTSLVSTYIRVKFMDEPTKLEGGVHKHTYPEVDAIALAGNDDIKTTDAVSASMYGVGDMVAVLCAVTKYLVVSLLDTYNFINTGRLALIHEHALLEVLNNLCVRVSYTHGAYSYADFHDARLGQTTRIDGVPHKDTNRFLNRLLKSCQQGARNEVSKIFYPTYDETIGGGPSPAPVQKIGGSRRYGNTVNHLPCIPFSPMADTYYNSLYSMYSNTETGLDLARSHPLDAVPTFKNYFNQTVVWFQDADPDFVLIIVCHPTWDVNRNLAQYIQFLEVPVYGFCERKRLDGTNEATTGPSLCWQRYEDQVRPIHTIQRTWIDWTVFDNSDMYTAMLYRCPSVIVSKTDANNHLTFGYNEGYGYTIGNEVSEAKQLKRILGSIQRTVRTTQQGPADNGSPFDYTIAHDNVNDGYTNVSLWYGASIHYHNDGVQPHEYQNASTPTKAIEFPIWDDGTKRMYKKIDFAYSCTGQYADMIGSTGMTSWAEYNMISSSGAHFGSTTAFDNKAWEYIYFDGTLLYTNYWEAIYASSLMSFVSHLNVIHFMDQNLGLFVIEEVRQTINPCLGIAAACTGSLVRNLVVLYAGNRYVIWTHTISVTLCPGVWNWFPWLKDATWPTYNSLGSPALYNLSETRDCIWWWFPFLPYYTNPTMGLTIGAAGYPAPSGTDTASVLFGGILNTDKMDKASNILVDIDPDTFSWVVRSDCWLQGGSIVYPNTNHVIRSINGNISTEEFSTIYKTITVDPSLMTQGD